MYPPERRARGISYVLFGSVFGAILGPAVFGPLFAGSELEAARAHRALARGGWDRRSRSGVVSCPAGPEADRRVARGRERPARRPRRCGDRAPPRRDPAMLAALASFGVMVSVMNLTGYVVVDNHHHQSDVFPIIGAHVLGMYALVIVVGGLIDRIGRPTRSRRAARDGGPALGLMWVESVFATAALLFGLGVGWNFSFVAATAQMVDRTAPSRARAADRLQRPALGAARRALALLGGYALDCGVAALAIGATAIVAAPVLLPRVAPAGVNPVQLTILFSSPPLSPSRFTVSLALARLARTLTHHWIAACSAPWPCSSCSVPAAGAGGEAADDFSTPGTESQKAIDLFRAHSPALAGADSTLVFTVEDGKITDAGPREAVQAALARSRSSPGVAAGRGPVRRGRRGLPGRPARRGRRALHDRPGRHREGRRRGADRGGRDRRAQRRRRSPRAGR